MKRIFRFLFLLSLGLLCQAQNPAVGTWSCQSDDGHGAVKQWTLTLNGSGGKLSGNIVHEDLTMPLIEPTLEGAKLSFKTFINPNCTILWDLTISGRKLDGKFACPEVSGTMTGTRKP